MELNKIELLLEKYFDGETSIHEENKLRTYFSSQKVASHLEQYKALFSYFEKEKKHEYSKKINSKSTNYNTKWWAIAASFIVLFGLGFYYFKNETEPVNKIALGTYNNPEIAFKETQKALAMLSTNVNVGIESVQYVEEFEITKRRIFKN